MTATVEGDDIIALFMAYPMIGQTKVERTSNVVVHVGAASLRISGKRTGTGSKNYSLHSLFY